MLATYLGVAVLTFAFHWWWERRHPCPVFVRPIPASGLFLVSLAAAVWWPLWWPFCGVDMIRSRCWKE